MRVKSQSATGTKTFLPSLIILSALLVPVAQAATLSPELSARMAALGPAGEIPVIITFSKKVDVTSLLPLERKTRRREIIGALKGRAAAQQKEVRQFLAGKGRRTANGSSTRSLPGSRLTRSPRSPGFRKLTVSSLDAVIPAPAPLAAAAAQPEWNIAKVRAPELWLLGFTGSGVVAVATMDTGVDVLHPELQARWRGGGNSWFNPTQSTAFPACRTTGTSVPSASPAVPAT